MLPASQLSIFRATGNLKSKPEHSEGFTSFFYSQEREPQLMPMHSLGFHVFNKKKKIIWLKPHGKGHVYSEF